MANTRFATTGPVGPQLGPSDAANLREQFNALVADVAAIRTGLVGVTAQLDADAGVTDTDYAATNDPAAVVGVDLTAV